MFVCLFVFFRNERSMFGLCVEFAASMPPLGLLKNLPRTRGWHKLNHTAHEIFAFLFAPRLASIIVDTFFSTFLAASRGL